MPRLASRALPGLVVCLLSGLGTGAGLGTGSAAAATLVETIQRVKPGVVGVGTYNSLRTPSDRLVGTGFIVGDGAHVVTNHHVVQPFRRLGRPSYLAVFIGTGTAARPRRARIVATDPARDVALLAFEGDPGPPLELDTADTIEEGRAIAFTGFPIGSVYGMHPVTHRGMVSAVTPLAIPQVSASLLDARMIKRLRDGFAVYQLDATAYPGNSGSPVYDPETGRVLGIVSSVFVKLSKEKVLSDPSGITFAIPIRFARDLLASVVPVEPVEPDEQDGEE